jgi:deazaflavin-dependent oxidoreductase (nitroreductase family)
MVFAAYISAILVIVLILLVRFRKRQMAVVHRVFTNRIMMPFAVWLPGFAVVTSVGRKSGKIYRTPVNVFRASDRFLIALTYGPDSGWVKNVLAAGQCQMETGRVSYRLFCPVLVHDPSRRRFPLVVRLVLGLIEANHCLELRRVRRSSPLVTIAKTASDDRDRITP